MIQGLDMIEASDSTTRNNIASRFWGFFVVIYPSEKGFYERCYMNKPKKNNTGYQELEIPTADLFIQTDEKQETKVIKMW